MSSSSRSPTRSRPRDAVTDVASQQRQQRNMLNSLGASNNGITSSTRYQSSNSISSSSSTAAAAAASTIRRQSLFGTDDRVVLDIGARVSKIGFSGEARPRDIFCSVETSSSHDTALWTTDLYRCRSEAERRLIEVQLRAKFTRLFRRIFHHQLMIDPKQRKVIIAENALLPEIIKRTMCEVLFGNLQVPSICFVPVHLLSTLAIGRTTSMVLDIGFHEATLLPIYHGRGLNHTHLLTSPRAGERLVKRLRALLLHFATYVAPSRIEYPNSGIVSSSTSVNGKVPIELLTWDFLEEIKAKALLVGDFIHGDNESSNDVFVQQSQDTRSDWTKRVPFSKHDETDDHTFMKVLESRYKHSSRSRDLTIMIPPLHREPVSPATQPSTLGAPIMSPTAGLGSILIPGWIRERAAEVLFESGDEDEMSLVEMIVHNLIKLPIDLRAPLANNIYISGGTAMIPGLANRISKEVIKRLVESSSKTRRPDVVALSLPRVGPAKVNSSTKASIGREAIDTIEEKEEVGEGSQLLVSESNNTLFTVESKIMKQRREEMEKFQCRPISSLASSIAILNDHAPRVDADGHPIGGGAPSFPANLSAWIGGSLMGSLRIGVINETSREVWDEEQEEIDAAKIKKSNLRPGMGAGRGSFLGSVSGLDLGTYGALSSGARGTFSSNTPRSPSSAA